MLATRTLALACAVSLSVALPAGGYTNQIENQTIQIVDSDTWELYDESIYVGQLTHGNGLLVNYSTVQVFNIEIGGMLGASNNWMTINGTNSIVALPAFITVGREGSGNNLSIIGGSKVSITDELVIGDESTSLNNWVDVNGYGSKLESFLIDVGNTGSGNILSIGNSGSVECEVLRIGRNSGANGNVVSVSDAWLTVLSSISIGYQGSSNALWITDGGGVVSYSGMYIGSSLSNATGNTVIISDPGSKLDCESVYLRGGGGPSGNGNSLIAANAGYVHAGTMLENDATLSFMSGGRVYTGNYTQKPSAVLQFSDFGGNPLISANVSHFESGAVIEFARLAADLVPDQTYTQSLVQANSLTIGGSVDVPDVNLLEINNVLGSLFGIQLTASTEALDAQLMRRSLTSSAGFTDGSDLAEVSDEIDKLYSGQDANAIQQWNRYNTMSSDQQREEIGQLYDRGAPSYQHSQGMNDGVEQARKRADVFLAGRGGRPTGAAGPSSREVPFQGWIKAYGSWGEHDGASGLPGYDIDVIGTVMGFDKQFKDMLVGIAGGYAESDLALIDGDQSNGKTGFGMIYVSKGSKDWFGDVSISHGITKVETSSGTGSDAQGEVNADSFGFYAGGGKEMELSEDRYLFTPEASLLIGYYGQGGYTETSSSSVPRIVEPYERWSFLSALGTSFAFQKELRRFVLKPELRVYWLHEFNADADELGYSLAGGTGRYTFAMLPPEQDTIELGVGISTRFSDRMELILDIDGRFSENYQDTTISGRIAYEF